MNANGNENEIIPDCENDTEFGTHLSWTNRNTIDITKQSNLGSVTSSQRKHDININKPPNSDQNYAAMAKPDQLSVPQLSPENAVQSTTFSIHSGATKEAKTVKCKRVQHVQMVPTEASDVNHFYFTSMVSIQNFLCVAVLGQNSISFSNLDRPLLTSMNNRDAQLCGTEHCQFISIYCRKRRAGLSPMTFIPIPNIYQINVGSASE